MGLAFLSGGSGPYLISTHWPVTAIRIYNVWMEGMLQTSLFLSCFHPDRHAHTEIVISIPAQWPHLVLISQWLLNHPGEAVKPTEGRWVFVRWWTDRGEKERGDKGVFNAIKGTTQSQCYGTGSSSRLRFPPCLCVRFIVQFIGAATWSVRANPVTAQQKAKLRGVRGCRTGRLTGWVTPFARRIASCQSRSCHLDRNPFFRCNPHRQPFCHSRPHTHTHLFPSQ